MRASRLVPSVVTLGLVAGALLAAVLPGPPARACTPRSPDLLRHGNRYRVIIHGHHGSFNFTPPEGFSQNDVAFVHVSTRDYAFARFVADSRHGLRGVIDHVLLRQGPQAARSRAGLARAGRAVADALVALYLKVSRLRVAAPEVRLLVH